MRFSKSLRDSTGKRERSSKEKVAAKGKAPNAWWRTLTCGKRSTLRSTPRLAFTGEERT